MAMCFCCMGIAGSTTLQLSSATAHGWLFGDVGCQVDGFIMTFLGLSEIHLLACIALERYIRVVKISWTNIVTQWSTKAAVLVCFVCGFVWAVLPLAGVNAYILEAGFFCSVDWRPTDVAGYVYTVTLLIGCLFVPVAVIIGCYTSILYRLVSIFKCLRLTYSP